MKDAVKVIGGMVIVAMIVTCISFVWIEGYEPLFRKIFITQFFIGLLCYAADRN